MVQGGFSTGHEVTDNCDVVGKVDNASVGVADLHRSSIGNTTPLVSNVTGVTSPSLLYCHNAAPYKTQIKLLGAVPLPWGVAASAAFQSVPGPQITATYVARSAQIAPSLGRNLAAGPNGTVALQLIAPNSVYSDRYNQLDTRLTRNFNLGGRRRLQAQFDFYNLLNVNTTLALNTTYGAAWQSPLAIATGRMFKFGAQFDF
jgi:hypothetical protein